MANIPLFNLEGRKPYVQFSHSCIKKMNDFWDKLPKPKAALLGKNKEGVIVNLIPLVTSYKCSWEPTIPSESIAKATIVLLKKKLSPAGLYITHAPNKEEHEASIAFRCYSSSLSSFLRRTNSIAVLTYESRPHLIVNDKKSYVLKDSLGWVTVK